MTKKTNKAYYAFKIKGIEHYFEKMDDADGKFSGFFSPDVADAQAVDIDWPIERVKEYADLIEEACRREIEVVVIRATFEETPVTFSEN